MVFVEFIMKIRLTIPSLFLLLALPASAQEQWIHIGVDEMHGGRSRVRINLPLSLVERALPLIPVQSMNHCRFGHGGEEVGLETLRLAIRELEPQEESAVVTVSEEVRATRRNGHLLLEVRDRWSGASDGLSACRWSLLWPSRVPREGSMLLASPACSLNAMMASF